MKNLLVIIFSSFISVHAFSQTGEDSVEILSTVVVRAFSYDRKYADIPASIAVIGKSALERYSNISPLPAMNSMPGIRMEERSPGSYRINIRGSSLRSPFGVRNVKIYYNDIPYTDPGGNSFFNMLGYYTIQSMEIVKGPGSSLYGAGTGGLILLNSERKHWSPGVDLDFSAGSYNARNFNINARAGEENFTHTVNYQHQVSDGYRDHTQMERKSFSWDAAARVSEKGKLSAHFLYGDLYYQTPGALTLTEYKNNPRASRPAAGVSPSAKEAQAAIRTRMFIAGLRYQHNFSERWSNLTTLYGAYSKLENPAIRNFERRTEPHLGARTMFEYNQYVGEASISLNFGIEAQQGFATVRVADNIGGRPAALQTDDEFDNSQIFGFAQLNVEWNSGWMLTLGSSINRLTVTNNRLFPSPALDLRRKYNNELAPRIALLKKIQPGFTVFASLARGFSPPTNGELLPSTGNLNYDLEAESGYAIEAGVRTSLINNRLYIDVNLFNFQMKNTIAQRRDEFGADFFINAGRTKQQGIESLIVYDLPFTRGWAERISARLSHSFSNFSYLSFTRGQDDFSGRKLPSIAPHVISVSLDFHSRSGIYTNLSWYYSDAIPLNDANTVFADAFAVSSARLGYKKRWSAKFQTEIFAAADNLFNKQYSLGNDINAFGNRFFNAAPGVNYTVGIRLKTDFSNSANKN